MAFIVGPPTSGWENVVQLTSNGFDHDPPDTTLKNAADVRGKFVCPVDGQWL